MMIVINANLNSFYGIDPHFNIYFSCSNVCSVIVEVDLLGKYMYTSSVCQFIYKRCTCNNKIVTKTNTLRIDDFNNAITMILTK